MQKYNFKAQSGDNGKRLDILAAEFSKKRKLGYSRSFIQELILDGRLSVNNASQLSPHYKVKALDEIKIIVEEKPSGGLSAESIPLNVVYEDKDLAVINKEAGIVVHPAPGNQEHTLVNALLNRFKELSNVDPKRPGIVHRLDKDTSGLLVVAKNNFAHQDLARQFAEHSIERKYIALVKGRVEFDEDIIEIPIGRNPLKRKSMQARFGVDTKYAKTIYRTIKRSNDYSLLELRPFTGRTHQIRVHLAFLGHPILGDKMYGKHDNFKRLALHAQYIKFIHPRSKKALEFSSKAPKEFEELTGKNKT